MDLANVTRLEVIDHTASPSSGVYSRIVSRKDISVDVSLQDDGRTLKVFLKDPVLRCDNCGRGVVVTGVNERRYVHEAHGGAFCLKDVATVNGSARPRT